MLAFSAHYVSSIIDKCMALGVDRRALIELVPKGEISLANPLYRLPAHILADIYARAKHITKMDDIGLRVAQQINAGSLYDSGRLLALCATIGDVATMLSRYHRVTHTLGETKIYFEGPVWGVEWVAYYEDKETYTDVLLAIFGSYICGMNWLLANEISERVILEFEADLSFDTSDFESKYGCEIRFGTQKTRIVMPESLHSRTLNSSDAELLDLMIERVDRTLILMDGVTAIVRSVGASIRGQIPHGAPTLKQTSVDLGVSERQIQQALSDNGKNFRQQVEQCRIEACQLYLSGGVIFSQMAQNLGYHDQPAFNRAFKRWFGVTPSQYKRT